MFQRNAAEELSDACNDVLWHYRKSITEEAGFIKFARKECGEELDKTVCSSSSRKPGMGLVTCIIENKDKISNLRCQGLVTKLEGVIFSDYELIERFADKCQSDIGRFQCGRNEAPHHAERVILNYSISKFPHCPQFGLWTR